MAIAEPERELVRRALPFGGPAIVTGFLLGSALGGWNAGWSAAIGVAVVMVNFALHGLSLARAARISLTALYAVGLGGFLVRLAAIVLLMVLLNRLQFFSPLAFVLAVMPATVLLLVFEMKQLGGRMQAELWRLPARGTAGR